MLYCRRVLFQIICDNHSKSYKRTTHTHSIIIRNTLLARNILHFRPTAAVTFPGCSILETFKAYSLTILYINERSFARFCSLLFLALGINYFLPLSVCLRSLVAYQWMGVARSLLPVHQRRHARRGAYFRHSSGRASKEIGRGCAALSFHLEQRP